MESREQPLPTTFTLQCHLTLEKEEENFMTKHLPSFKNQARILFCPVAQVPDKLIFVKQHQDKNNNKSISNTIFNLHAIDFWLLRQPGNDKILP
jgi:hypothetical protein